jgi:hypothetical protein
LHTPFIPNYKLQKLLAMEFLFDFTRKVTPLIEEVSFTDVYTEILTLPLVLNFTQFVVSKIRDVLTFDKRIKSAGEFFNPLSLLIDPRTEEEDMRRGASRRSQLIFDDEKRNEKREEFIDYLTKAYETYRNGTNPFFNQTFDSAIKFDIKNREKLFESTNNIAGLAAIIHSSYYKKSAPIPDSILDSLKDIENENDMKDFVYKTVKAEVKKFGFKIKARDQKKDHLSDIIINIREYVKKNRHIIFGDTSVLAQKLVVDWFGALFTIWDLYNQFEQIPKIIKEQKHNYKKTTRNMVAKIGRKETPEQYRARKVLEEEEKSTVKIHTSVTRSFGLAMQKARNEKKWTQNELARRCGVKPGTIKEYENPNSLTVKNDAVIRKIQRILQI